MRGERYVTTIDSGRQRYRQIHQIVSDDRQAVGAVSWWKDFFDRAGTEYHAGSEEYCDPSSPSRSHECGCTEFWTSGLQDIWRTGNEPEGNTWRYRQEHDYTAASDRTWRGTFGLQRKHPQKRLCRRGQINAVGAAAVWGHTGDAQKEKHGDGDRICFVCQITGYYGYLWSFSGENPRKIYDNRRSTGSFMWCDRTICGHSECDGLSGWFYRLYTDSVSSDDQNSAVGTESGDDIECGRCCESLSGFFCGAFILSAEGYDLSTGTDLSWESYIKRQGYSFTGESKWTIQK